MVNTVARIKKAGKHFEVIVDMNDALKFKRGESSFLEAEIDKVFSDSKKGMAAPYTDLMSAFGTDDVSEIVKKIVKDGEVLVSQEHRDAEREKKYKQIIDFLVMNAVDPYTGNPHTSERIKNALSQLNVNIKNTPIENQIKDILGELSKVLPLKLKIKKIKVTIPAIHTGRAYGIINAYKEEENWLDDGSLEVILNVPSGMILDFYDKINSATQGSVLTEEIKE
jgi:rRNA metabolism SBDS family protein